MGFGGWPGGGVRAKAVLDVALDDVLEILRDRVAAQRQALEQAAARVRRYHQWQRQQGGALRADDHQRRTV